MVIHPASTTIARSSSPHSLRSILLKPQCAESVGRSTSVKVAMRPRRSHSVSFEGGDLISTSYQYRLVTDPQTYNVEEEVASGRATIIGDDLFRQFRVVYVGMEMIELRDLSTTSQTFTGDFFIYFRFRGDDSPLNIVFTNSVDPSLGTGDAITESINSGGMN